MSKGERKEWITIQSRLSMASKIRHPFKESWSVVFVATDCLLRISNNLKCTMYFYKVVTVACVTFYLDIPYVTRQENSTFKSCSGAGSKIHINGKT